MDLRRHGWIGESNRVDDIIYILSPPVRGRILEVVAVQGRRDRDVRMDGGGFRTEGQYVAMSAVDQRLRIAGGEPDEFLIGPEHEVELEACEPIKPIHLILLVVDGANARIELAGNRKGLCVGTRHHERRERSHNHPTTLPDDRPHDALTVGLAIRCRDVLPGRCESRRL